MMTNRQIDLQGVDKVDELVYEHLEPKFVKVQTVLVVMGYLCVMLVPLSLLLINDFPYRMTLLIVIEAVLLLLALVNIWFVPKAYRYKGFAIREHDISYRSGLIFPKTITVPFCKIQQVNVGQGFVPRMFGLYEVDVVNGAQMLSSLAIPGLTAERANQIKELVMRKVKDEKQ